MLIVCTSPLDISYADEDVNFVFHFVLLLLLLLIVLLRTNDGDNFVVQWFCCFSRLLYPPSTSFAATFTAENILPRINDT